MRPPLFIFTFTHRARRVEVGPVAGLDEARATFLRVYGYAPAAPLSQDLWKP